MGIVKLYQTAFGAFTLSGIASTLVRNDDRLPSGCRLGGRW